MADENRNTVNGSDNFRIWGLGWGKLDISGCDQAAVRYLDKIRSDPGGNIGQL